VTLDSGFGTSLVQVQLGPPVNFLAKWHLILCSFSYSPSFVGKMWGKTQRCTL